jgi:lysophospholipase L1-like esterase
MKCGNTIKKLQSGEKTIIAALGDSLTYGWMVRKGYLNFLEEMLLEKYPASDFRILNRGIPGDTSRGGLGRLERQVIDHKPDLVMLQFGLNDALAGFTPQAFYYTMKSLVDDIRGRIPAEILLMTSVKPLDGELEAMAAPYYEMIENLAGAEALPAALVHRYWEKEIAGGVNHMDLVQEDMAHPTVQGYWLMARSVMEFLV